MLKHIAEMIGTFILLFVILNNGETIPIAIALAAGIYMTGNISGGHLNPIVSTVMLLKHKIDVSNYISYIFSQLAGGILAYKFHSLIKTE
tara:strand:+ start:372 stop:641 length:270 start_codon:yes stop_codon:yes gene_type:complete